MNSLEVNEFVEQQHQLDSPSASVVRKVSPSVLSLKRRRKKYVVDACRSPFFW